MHRWSGIVFVGLLMACTPLAVIAGVDPGSLVVERMPQDVRLTWSGDESAYVVYRSDRPFSVHTTTNEISRTTAVVYEDPLDGIGCDPCFYLVLPEEWFTCGGLHCSIDTEYCLIFYPGVPGSAAQYECQALPTECQAEPTCPCAQDDEWPPPAASCSQDAAGGITIAVFAP